MTIVKLSPFPKTKDDHLTDLTRVLLPVLVSGAEEGVSDGLLVAGGVEHLLAAEVINHRHRDLVQDIGHSASCKCTESSNKSSNKQMSKIHDYDHEDYSAKGVQIKGPVYFS